MTPTDASAPACQSSQPLDSRIPGSTAFATGSGTYEEDVNMKATETVVRQWSRPLRLIHLLLAIAVTVQLFIGGFMQDPRQGVADSLGFQTHEILGAVILVLLAAHWIWSCTHRDEGLRHLFPWTRKALHNAFAELCAAVRALRLPPGGPGTGDGGLVGLVHGLGLLAITAVAFVGGVYFLARVGGASHHGLDTIENVHATLAVLAWIYWSGHLAATLLHSVLHQTVSNRMFTLDIREPRR